MPRMSLPIMHTDAGIGLPIRPETGMVILGIGVAVLAVISYDIYRQHWPME